MKNKKLMALIACALILLIGLAILIIEMNNSDSDNNRTSSAASEVSKEAEAEQDEKAGNHSTAEGESSEENDVSSISSEEAVYEEWLAASAVTAISLSYPDFEIQEILAASKTELKAMEDSKGVYVKFVSGGESLVIYSKPLEEERSKKGTVDLHEEKLGFATFDLVNTDSLQGQELETIDMDTLNELIAESMLVSIYEHY